MKISANDIRIGNIILYDNKYLVILKTMHTQPGKGGAYIQLEMKNIKTSAKINTRFRSTENVEKIRLEQYQYQFLYEEGVFLILMDQISFEQKIIDKSLIGEQTPFLQEGMNITLEMHDNEPVLAYLPASSQVIVKECEPAIRAQTSTSSYKPATLENGVRVMVPPFINEGDQIIVDLKEFKYLERVR